ncbi:hypothetical protein ACTVPB_04115 [Serratia marcescens]|uniref:hypothetical protein n=1 Tax=Serratia marcescens TaxID=615 RepID=UPI003FA79142
MTINHDDFLQKQITAQLREARFNEAVATTSASAAVQHQRHNPNMKLPDLLLWARSFAKHCQRLKGKPAPQGTRATARN